MLGRSKNAGSKAVMKILEMEERLVVLQKQLHEMAKTFAELEINAMLAQLELQSAVQNEVAQLQSNIRVLRAKLGGDDNAELRRLQDSEYLRKVVNARALKERIRAKLIERKFALARMERACITSKSGKDIGLFQRSSSNQV